MGVRVVAVSDRMMRALTLLACIILAVAAVPSEFNEVAPVVETDLLSEAAHDAQQSVDAMKASGATEADCENLADSSCKEVETEIKTDQRLVNKLSDGSNCRKIGHKWVHKATLHWKRTKSTWGRWKIKVSKTLRTSVSINAQRFSSLRRGRCGFVFGSRNYLSLKRTYDHSVKYEVQWRGRTREAWKAVLRSRISRTRAQKKCRCAAKTAEARTWRVVNSVTRVRKQTKAHAKCRMMKCVLKGIPLSNSQCRSNLKRLVRKRLSIDVQRTSCHGGDLRPAPAKRRLGRL